MKNVKMVIDMIEIRRGRAERNLVREQEKGSRTRISSIMRIIQGHDELIKVMGNKNRDTKVILITEAEFEERFGIYEEYAIQREVCRNTVATILELASSDDESTIMVVCTKNKWRNI